MHEFTFSVATDLSKILNSINSIHILVFEPNIEKGLAQVLPDFRRAFLSCW